MPEPGDEPRDGGLAHVVVEVPEVLAGIVPAAGEEDETGALLDHSTRGEPSGRELAPEPGLEHRLPAGSDCPQSGAPNVRQRGGRNARRVAHDEIEPAGFPLDPLEQRLHLRVVGVVGARGNAASAAGDDLLATSSTVVRPLTYTVAPASPRTSATPRPTPRVAPVTSATHPSSRGVPRSRHARLRRGVERGLFLLGHPVRVPLLGKEPLRTSSAYRSSASTTASPSSA